MGDLIQEFGMRHIELKDKPLFDEAFSSLKHPISDYTFANTFIWRAGLSLYWQMIEGHLCVFANGAGDLTMLIPPVGEGRLDRCIEQCFEIMNGYNAQVAHPSHSRIEYVSGELWARLQGVGALSSALMGGDYVYETRKMIELSGGDLKSKRQARNKFAREHAVRTETLGPDHVDGCRRLLREWQERADVHATAADPLTPIAVELRRRDTLATQLALDEHVALGLSGMVLLADERLIGFTLGEPLDRNQASILIEKTDLELYGSAQFIFSEFCRQRWAAFPECNVGDDWGIPSLRWTKESYRPLRLLSKYVVTREAAPMVGWRAEPDINPVNPRHMTSAGMPPSEAGDGVIIDRAAVTDLEALVALESVAFPRGGAVNRRQMRYLLRSKRALIAVARESGGVIGWAIALLRRHPKYETARIYSLAVAPQRRGRGVGERLCRHLLREAEEMGIGRCFLEVAQENHAARSLYQRLGFTPVATLPHYYGEGAHGVRMVRVSRERVPPTTEISKPLGLV